MSFESRNIRLELSYDGTEFSGWQRQKNNRTIQGEIERVLKRMTNEDILLNGAGRTDAGVHAEGMVAHFHTTSAINCKNFLRGLNTMLPSSIRILSVEEADPVFHARFSAIGKHYQYEIFTGQIQSPRLRLYTLHITCPLNLTAIERCLEVLVGTHDFSSFENSGSRDKTYNSGRGPVRTIHEAKLVVLCSNLLALQFSGDGFLRNMVRNLVGTLLEVGRGKISPEDFVTILKAQKRAMAGPTAPPHGLCLKKVLY